MVVRYPLSKTTCPGFSVHAKDVQNFTEGWSFHLEHACLPEISRSFSARYQDEYECINIACTLSNLACRIREAIVRPKGIGPRCRALEPQLIYVTCGFELRFGL